MMLGPKAHRSQLAGSIVRNTIFSAPENKNISLVKKTMEKKETESKWQSRKTEKDLVTSLRFYDVRVCVDAVVLNSIH